MKFYTSIKRYGNELLYRGYDLGRPVTQKVKFSPSLYIKTQNTTEYKSIYGDYVNKVPFKNMREATDVIKANAGNNSIFGTKNYIHQFVAEKFPNDIEFNIDDINVVNFDIEVASADGFPVPEEAAHPIISITVKSSKLKVYYVWGLDDYDTSKTEIDLNKNKIEYVKCKNEQELIARFLVYWTNNYPDVITGWNTRFFDVPYLVNRIRNTTSESLLNRLSPWGLVNQREIFKGLKNLQTYDIIGIQQADYLELFQKFGYSYGAQETYRLDHIGYVVLGEKKLSYDDYGNLYTLYKENHQKFIDYNIKDVQLVERIDEKMGLISLALTMAYKGGVNLSDTFGTTAIWDSIIYRRLINKNILPPIEQIRQVQYNLSMGGGMIAGGYVKEPQVGAHDWVVSFDLNSLYPNIIVQQNISPETIAGERFPQGTKYYLDVHDRKKQLSDKLSVCSSGVTFEKTKQGIIPEIIIDYYSERSAVKKEMLRLQSEYQKTKSKELEFEINQLENNQMAIKILLNSLYGALGNKYFKYHDNALAESVTLTGQTVIRWAEKAINDEMNKLLKSSKKDYVIAIDTDSVYINMGPIVEKFEPKNPVEYLDNISKGFFEKVLKKSYDEFFYMTNGYTPRMEMAREVIADKGIWTAKKRYILNVHNSEGVQYEEPKLKIMGIEAIKSSTPEVVRDKFKEIFKVIMTQTETDTQNFIAKFKSEFSSLPPEAVSFPRSVTNLFKWHDKNTIYKKATPIHVRGALMHNNLIKEYNLTKKYEIIKNGEKIKFCYLKMPNHTRENVITFSNNLPKEFNLHRYIDYNLQFEKTFIEPLKLILDAIGWRVEALNTLDDFFV